MPAGATWSRSRVCSACPTTRVRRVAPAQGDRRAAPAADVRAGRSVAERVRPNDAGCAQRRRSLDRAAVPAEGSRVAARAAPGRRLAARPGLARDFHAAGLGHLLVVSGENVAMVLAPILAVAALLGLTRWPTFVVCVGVVVFFVVLTGGEPSVMRAGVMATIALVGMLIGRPRTRRRSCSAAVLWPHRPRSLARLVDRFPALGHGDRRHGRARHADRRAIGRFLPRPVALAAAATIAAQIGVTPILLFHFHDVPVVTVPANLPRSRPVAPSLLLGAVAAGTGLVWIPVGQLVGARRGHPDALPGAGRRSSGEGADRVGDVVGGLLVLVGGFAIVVAIACGSAAAAAAPTGDRGRVAFLPVVVWSTALGTGPPSGFVVRFFDVGQGDAALDQDAGGSQRAGRRRPGRRAGRDRVSAVGVKRLDLVVASHPHADHIIGLPAVLARIPVGMVLQPGCEGLVLTDPDRPGPGDRRRARPGPEPARRRHIHGRLAAPRGAVARPLLERDGVRHEQRRDRPAGHVSRRHAC